MRFSQAFIPTLRDDPADAEVVSHRLMLRAGLIRKVAAGVYTYLPLAWRTLRKVEQIIREEMVRAGAQEIRMPAVQPAELWQESGRWDVYGRELLRLKDRHEREFCVGPKQKSRSWRSFIRSMSGPNTSQRPLSCHSSAGCTAGMNTSSAPAAFISSRITCSTFRRTRRPSGSHE